MCLTTATTMVTPSAAAVVKKDEFASTTVIKKCVSDTNLMSHFDFDEKEDYDSFYIPGGGEYGNYIDVDDLCSSDDDDDDSDDTTTVTTSVVVDVDTLTDSLEGGSKHQLVQEEPQKQQQVEGMEQLSKPKGMTKKDRNVSFGSLSELSFNVIQGESSTELQFPLMLGWDCMDASTQSVDEYEENRKHSRLPSEDLYTTVQDRLQIIENSKKAHKELAKKLRQQQGPFGRRRVQRRNSMANGMMFGRDSRRNRVQEFIGRMAGGKKL